GGSGGDAGSGAGGSGGDAGSGAGGSGGDAGSGAGGSGGDAGSGAGGSGGSAGSGAGLIGCGAQTCGLNQGEFCCLAQGAEPSCKTQSNQCNCSGVLCQTIELRCDGSEDCPGKICCLERAIASNPKVTCAQTCDSMITVDRKEVCKVGTSGGCSKGSCKQAQGLPPGVGNGE